MSAEKGTVFIVDDDPAICAALARLFKSVGLPARSFTGPREFLAQGPNWDRAAWCWICACRV